MLPLGGALLALTSALAAACFVKAFALTFLARPRSRAAAEATESSALLLAPQAFLAAACVALGLFPGVVLRVLAGVAASLPGMGPRAGSTGGLAGVTVGVPAFDQLSPLVLLPAVLRRPGPGRVARSPLGAGPAAGADLGLRRRADRGDGVHRDRVRQAARDGLPGHLPPDAGGLDRRDGALLRERGALPLARSSAPFERHVYGPATRAVLAAAGRLRVIQAGSLHAYLAYVLVLGVILLWWLGGLP